MHKSHDVVVVGAGPTGMMLAAELSLADVDVVVVERRTSPALVGTRSRGLHARTLEVFDQRGIAGRFLSQGQAMQVAQFAGVPLDISDFPTRHNYGLALAQSHTEQILADWLTELAVPMLRGVEVDDVAQDEDGVDVALSDGRRLRGAYVVGCDGGRSVVRHKAGIRFPGQDASTSWLVADVQTAVEPAWGMRQDRYGTHGIGKLDDGRTVSLVVNEPQLRTGEPTLDELREALVAVYGNDFGVHSPGWLSRFTDTSRQAETYRRQRVLLAGDAAHVHPPQGGQGLNLGVQDAVNLGWKLAQVVKGISPDTLLDSYHAERHPVGERVLHVVMAQVALRRRDEQLQALTGFLGQLLAMREPRTYMAGVLSCLDLHYPLGEGHALLGRRMPDLDLTTAEGPRRVYSLLHDARPLLLDFGAPGRLDIGAWAGRIRRVDARCDGPWELPVLGTVPAPDAVLIRPDGHVAWVGEGSEHGLVEAMTTWFGAPATT
ncbi:MAG TPA: FAD-dependent monooxygenase [Arenimonas sp.]|nr:FAD-dependent monooxygenase [Arenimonas sp.]